MTDYMDIIYKYEKQGIPYRDRNDDIRVIVVNLSRLMYDRKIFLLEEAISDYLRFSYINDIVVSGNKCFIKYDEGIISFSVPSSSYCERFNADVFDLDDTSGFCHEVTQKVLEGCHSENISAVTSLCVNTNFILYFHSYIHDRSSNKIIDFSRNIIMDKDDYDRLFCYQEINDLNYYEYKKMLKSSEHNREENRKFYSLLFLAIERLKNNDLVDTSNFTRHI